MTTSLDSLAWEAWEARLTVVEGRMMALNNEVEKTLVIAELLEATVGGQNVETPCSC